MRKRVTEVTITKTKCRPRAVRLGWLRKWRWQVTAYNTYDPFYHPGVYDGRVHLGDSSGYTFTRAGAAHAAGKRVAKANEPEVYISLKVTNG